MKSIQLRHIELTEELRDHAMTGTYYRVAKWKGSGWMKVIPETTTVLPPDVEVHTYEIIEVRGASLGEKTYFGLNIDQYGILYALLGHTQNTIEQKVEKALDNERAFSKWMMERKIREIKALPWYKRLFNKF